MNPLILKKHFMRAASWLGLYDYAVPFDRFFRNQTVLNKNMGSRDRRQVKQACYAALRMGKAYNYLSIYNKIVLYFKLFPFWPGMDASVLWDHAANQPLLFNEDGWPVDWNRQSEFLFPAYSDVSESIASSEFLHAHLVQGLVFFRILNPEKIEDIISQIPCEEVGLGLYSAQIGSNLKPFVEKGMIQIQDLSSSKACNDIALPAHASVWDVCAGAGGKFLNLASQKPTISFYVSDIREQILTNLKKRAISYGLTVPPMAVLNLQDPHNVLHFSKPLPGNKTNLNHEKVTVNPASFDVIIVDAPCTGSGVWRRNPEHLTGFQHHAIQKFASKQRRIVANSIPFLKPGGALYYITCSVFSSENENQTHFFEKTLGLLKKSETYYNTLSDGGDILYQSVWIKSNT